MVELSSYSSSQPMPYPSTLVNNKTPYLLSQDMHDSQLPYGYSHIVTPYNAPPGTPPSMPQDQFMTPPRSKSRQPMRDQFLTPPPTNRIPHAAEIPSSSSTKPYSPVRRPGCQYTEFTQKLVETHDLLIPKMEAAALPGSEHWTWWVSDGIVDIVYDHGLTLPGYMGRDVRTTMTEEQRKEPCNQQRVRDALCLAFVLGMVGCEMSKVVGALKSNYSIEDRGPQTSGTALEGVFRRQSAALLKEVVRLPDGSRPLNERGLLLQYDSRASAVKWNEAKNNRTRYIELTMPGEKHRRRERTNDDDDTDTPYMSNGARSSRRPAKRRHVDNTSQFMSTAGGLNIAMDETHLFRLQDYSAPNAYDLLPHNDQDLPAVRLDEIHESNQFYTLVESELEQSWQRITQSWSAVKGFKVSPVALMDAYDTFKESIGLTYSTALPSSSPPMETPDLQQLPLDTTDLQQVPIETPDLQNLPLRYYSNQLDNRATLEPYEIVPRIISMSPCPQPTTLLDGQDYVFVSDLSHPASSPPPKAHLNAKYSGTAGSGQAYQINQPIYAIDPRMIG